MAAAVGSDTFEQEEGQQWNSSHKPPQPPHPPTLVPESQARHPPPKQHLFLGL